MYKLLDLQTYTKNFGFWIYITKIPFPQNSLFPIFFISFLEHAYIAEIATLADFPLLHGFQHGTSRFVNMRAIIESAFTCPLEYFREIM